MNKMKFWQVDAFTKKPFSGNPAAVIYLESPLDVQTMQSIAFENNLAETAFVELRDNQNPLIRWFTPHYEIDLCGHATLAASHIYFSDIEANKTTLTFDSLKKGPLTVTKNDLAYTLNFPSYQYQPLAIETIPIKTINALSDIKPLAAYKGRDYLFIYENEDDILTMSPDFNAIKNEEKIIVSAKSNQKYDFISRFFCPNIGLNEDPVTGSAHCMLAPFWAEQLKKSNLLAYQASKRGGEIQIQYHQGRVQLTGSAVTLIKGEFIL
ncbi:PhzF family phenazine biosynthesis protein [Thiotrichales bacterium 19S3-7]|nr:PhzF family phenazine biosynthesis protein [Thiotrichales bacterium 19S3-7]MCF6801640.1 PhzF family phenazine biosynthesis protein [Thiotrichales bacterium 19S3-11]